MYNCLIDVCLKAHNNPYIRLKLDNLTVYEGILAADKTFNISQDLSIDKHIITVEMLKKSVRIENQSVIIDKIIFDNITADRFAWAGKYTPIYPQPWAMKQIAAGNTLEPVLNSTYLGWNGIWKLEFTVPVFTWIHKIEKLGWIYD